MGGGGGLRRIAAIASRRRRLGREGQSTVEFILTLTLLFGFALFFVQLALQMAWGSYIQYATFMAARAYLSAGDSKDDQQKRAEAYLVRMLKKQDSPDADRYPQIAKGADDPAPSGASEVRGMSLDHPMFDRNKRAQSWMQGVRYTFRSRIFVLPLAGPADKGSTRGDVNQMTLTSESWLGREPSYQECMTYMEQFGKLGEDWIIDNGC